MPCRDICHPLPVEAAVLQTQPQRRTSQATACVFPKVSGDEKPRGSTGFFWLIGLQAPQEKRNRLIPADAGKTFTVQTGKVCPLVKHHHCVCIHSTRPSNFKSLYEDTLSKTIIRIFVNHEKMKTNKQKKWYSQEQLKPLVFRLMQDWGNVTSNG